jgi:hypothetical protein
MILQKGPSALMPKLVERVALNNGLTLEVYDYSRPIAVDTTKLELVVRIKVPLLESYFQSRKDFVDTTNAFGQEAVFEYRKERTFVSNETKDSVFHELISTFKSDSLNYLSHEDFACKFALSKLRELRMNPFKYKKP